MYGSKDPDPYQNVTDPRHWQKNEERYKHGAVLTFVSSKNTFLIKFINMILKAVVEYQSYFVLFLYIFTDIKIFLQ